MYDVSNSCTNARFFPGRNVLQGQAAISWQGLLHPYENLRLVLNMEEFSLLKLDKSRHRKTYCIRFET